MQSLGMKCGYNTSRALMTAAKKKALTFQRHRSKHDQGGFYRSPHDDPERFKHGKGKRKRRLRKAPA